MAQVLKDEIKERIYAAAVELFFQKDFRSATMQEIAQKAGVTQGLIYSYFKNKEDLFDCVVQPVLINSDYLSAVKKAEASDEFEFDNYINFEREFYSKILEKHRQFVILMDKSAGTKHCGEKEKLITLFEEHIRSTFKSRKALEIDDFFLHILAGNVIGNLIEIARHYKNQEWAMEMMDLVARYFFLGSKSF